MGTDNQRAADLRHKSGPSFGLHLSFLSPELVEFAGLLGFEWLFLDAEHGPLNPHVCRELVRAADVHGMTCAVRVPQVDSAVIEPYLDIGVRGIIAPNIGSAAEAENLVAALKFAPDGRRGSAAKTRAASYGLTQSPTDFYKRANAQTLAVALIESQQGVDSVADIAAVPGIDYLGIGANDLGLSLGIAGGMADPQLRLLVERTQERIAASGKPQMAVVADGDQAIRAAAAGARLIAIPETVLLAGAGRAFLDKARS